MIINENYAHINEKDLISLINNTATKSKFEKDYLPILEKTQDGEYFIITNKYVYSNTGSMHYKYLHFDKDGKLLTDPSYNYTKMDTCGYLMKLILRYPISGEYSIEYFIKLNELEYSRNDSIVNNIPKQTYMFKSIDYKDILEDHIKKSLYNSNEFFTKYLDYDLK